MKTKTCLSTYRLRLFYSSHVKKSRCWPKQVSRIPRSTKRAASTRLYLLECARRWETALWVVVEDGPESLGVSLAVVMLSCLRRWVERHGARRTVHVAADWLQTSRRKPRRRDVTTHWWWWWWWWWRHFTSGRCRLTTHTQAAYELRATWTTEIK